MVIAEFYNGREVFITGATGYLGKSLFEKLLRSCPGITKIFILIRPKRGMTPMQRIKAFKDELLFERLNRERQNAFDKVIPIIGDCSNIGLGISQEDLKLLENVSVIFHEAANVKFDNDLCTSVLMNTRGTHELVKIALNLKNLICFAHISTAFINPHGINIKEKLYEPPIHWRTAIKIAETCDMMTLEALKQHFTDFSPTVYTFTKNLSESVISAYSDRLPMTILRPAIVSHSYSDPEPGFIDNLNGHTGLLAPTMVGFAQTTYCDPKLKMSLIPVDMITALTITGAYTRGVQELKSKNSAMTIRNFASGDVYDLTLEQSLKCLLEIVDKNPFQYTMWAPSARMTTNYAWYMTWVFLVHIPMALIYDRLLKLSNKPPILFKTTRRIVYTAKVLTKFSTKYFNFSNDGMWELLHFMEKYDKGRTFFADVRGYDFDSLHEGAIIGLKKYIFKEPIEATPAAKKRYKIFCILNEIVKLIVFLILTIVSWNLLNKLF